MFALVIQHHPYRTGTDLGRNFSYRLAHECSTLFGRWSLRQTRGGSIRLTKPQPQRSLTSSGVFDEPLPDLNAVSFALTVQDSTSVVAPSVSVDVKHSYMGDLVITLHPPVGSGGEPVVLHNRECGLSKDLKRTYDSSTTKVLLRFACRVCAGTWTLKVHDQALKDSGLSFHLRLSFRLPAENVRNMLFGKRKKNNANACAVCLNSVAPRHGCDVIQSPANRTFE